MPLCAIGYSNMTSALCPHLRAAAICAAPSTAVAMTPSRRAPSESRMSMSRRTLRGTAL